MSLDDFSERTQPATDRRRREARARGDIARSGSLVSAMLLLAAAVGLWWLGPKLATDLAEVMRSGLSANVRTLDAETVATQLTDLAMRVAEISLPVLLVIVGAAAVANLLQTGFLWVPARVIPQFDRLDASRTWAGWWTMHRWLTLSGALIKLLLLLVVLVIFVRMRLTSAGPLIDGTPAVILSGASRLIGELAIVVSLSLLALAIIDYGSQFWHREQRLRMTIEEVRREQREDEVDPRVKRRQREIASSNQGSVSSVEAVRGV